MTIDFATLSAEHFRPHLEETFYVLLPDAEPLALRLKEVEENPRARMPKAPAERRMPFSLLFTGDPNAVLRSDVLPLRHSVLGDLPPLLVNRVMSGSGVLDNNAWFQISFN